MKLLCLSKDSSILEQISQEANQQQWSVMIIKSVDEAVEAFREFEPDMLLVEVAQLEELKWWKDSGLCEAKPLLFMCGELSEEFLFHCFDVGADGFVPKSMFSRRYLSARVNSYLRRQGLADARRFVPRLGLVLDSQRYRVEVQGRGLALTLTEYKILRALSTDQEGIVARKEIQTQVFGDAQISKRSLDVHICALRKKLRPFSLDISSVRGVGYGLNPCAR